MSLIFQTCLLLRTGFKGTRREENCHSPMSLNYKRQKDHICLRNPTTNRSNEVKVSKRAKSKGRQPGMEGEAEKEQ
jgi:hypothetical protein